MPRDQIQSIAARGQILETLKFISRNSDFASLTEECYPGLIPNQIGSLNSAYSSLRNTGPNKWRSEVPQFEIPISDEILCQHHPTALLGGIIEGEGERITRCSFSICITFTTESSTSDIYAITTSGSSLNAQSCCLPGCQNTKRIVRRFHFDYQPGESNKPLSHIQYGGKFPVNDNSLRWHYCLEHFLESPRLHYLPMDLTLLLDLIIREFETPLRKWIQEPAWNHLVFKSQNLWWSDYWNWMASHLNRQGSPTFHQTIYGEA